MRKPTRGFILRLIGSISLVSILLVRLDWPSFFEQFAQLSPIYLLIPLVGYYTNVGLSSWKWRLILAHFQLKMGFRELYSIYLSGTFFSNFLPTTIGGDGYRYLRLRSEFPKEGDGVLSSIFLERGYGYIALLLVHFGILVMVWAEVLILPEVFWLEIGLILGIVVVGLLWWQRSRWLKPLQRWSIFVKFEGFLEALQVDDLGLVFKSLLLSTGFVLLSALGLYGFYLAVGEVLPFSLLLYLSTVINIAGVLPISINGIGLSEMLQFLLLQPLGVPVERVVAVGILLRVLAILFSLPGAGAYLGGSYRASGGETLENR